MLAGRVAQPFATTSTRCRARFGGHGDAYQHVINAAKAASRPIRAPGSWSSTLPAIFVIMTFMMWNWWSVYLSGELKSASNRNRQLTIMFGALVWDVVFIVIGVLLIYKVAGYQFMSALNTSPNAAYKISVRTLVPLLRVVGRQRATC